jgi:hypothetical protein
VVVRRAAGVGPADHALLRVRAVVDDRDAQRVGGAERVDRADREPSQPLGRGAGRVDAGDGHSHRRRLSLARARAQERMQARGNGSIVARREAPPLQGTDEGWAPLPGGGAARRRLLPSARPRRARRGPLRLPGTSCTGRSPRRSSAPSASRRRPPRGSGDRRRAGSLHWSARSPPSATASRITP